jgi:hypothetical protein
MLYKYAWQKGILKQKIELDFDEGSEDFREEGLVIPYADYLKMVSEQMREVRAISVGS